MLEKIPLEDRNDVQKAKNGEKRGNINIAGVENFGACFVFCAAVVPFQFLEV